MITVTEMSKRTEGAGRGNTRDLLVGCCSKGQDNGFTHTDMQGGQWQLPW